jgi:superfamily II DNA or RNA helicase
VSNFATFYESLSSDGYLRGKQFEHFVKWFLVNDPIWKTQVEQVWHWDEYPKRWGKDLGIDLVFQNKNGELWAVQAKCYAETTSITKAHVDSFISESDSKTFSGRLLIGTTDRLADNAKKVCDRQNVTRFLLSDFELSGVEFPDHYDDLLKAEPSKPPEPREHQLEAISAVNQGFKDTDRGQLIMACGTGKTFTTLWIKEALDATSTLILLPSLGLLSQTLHEWTKAANSTFEVLCVCSDGSVGNNSDDASYELVAQLPFPVTSDPQHIRAFLELSKPKVVFSTYQSSPLVAEAQAASTEVEFDLIVADEAHRCAGIVGDGFSSVLNGQRLRGKKRLFATATPRTYSKQIKTAAEGRGIEVVGMDDEAVFGKPLYTLSFGEAIERKLLTDYRVVIVGVDDAMLASWIKNREIVKTETGIQTDAESLAATVGLLKAINDYDLRRLISFHSRVRGAKAFAEEIHEVQKWMTGEDRLKNKLNSDYVSGAMPTDKRRQKLSQLKNVADGEVALLSNARCLSEGVDVPSLDGVAFIDPKNSQIDIIQAVGRAIRRSENKSFGTIVLPVFIRNEDNPEDAIESSNFKPIWNVINALKAHDQDLAFELEQLRTDMGKHSESGIRLDGLQKIYFDLPSKFDDHFVRQIKTVLVEQTTSSWDFWFGLLIKFLEVNGHSSPERDEVMHEKFKLGLWVASQRARREFLSADRASRLQGLVGWTWSVRENLWDSGFSELVKFELKHGHSSPNGKYTSDTGFKLGSWVNTQRNNLTEIDTERRQRLETLSSWTWDVLDEKWEEGFANLLKYVDANGSAVPKGFITDSGFKLGFWVNRQRSIKDKLSNIRKQRLESLDGWTWNVADQQWETGYKHLEVFLNIHGHASPLLSYANEKKYRLGQWVTAQRAKKNELSPDKLARLEGLQGWSWDRHDENWQHALKQLQIFAEKFKHSSPSGNYLTEDGFRLGLWVANQRNRFATMPEPRKALLEGLSGWTWDPFKNQWESAFSQLQEYARLHGNLLVPATFKTIDGFRLGGWVNVQRSSMEQLSLDKKLLLESLQGWTWDVRQQQWEEGFKRLEEFTSTYQHASPKSSYKTVDGYALGRWVSKQRSRVDKLTPLHKNRLGDLKGWTWDASDQSASAISKKGLGSANLKSNKKTI